MFMFTVSVFCLSHAAKKRAAAAHPSSGSVPFHVPPLGSSQGLIEMVPSKSTIGHGEFAAILCH